VILTSDENNLLKGTMSAQLRMSAPHLAVGEDGRSDGDDRELDGRVIASKFGVDWNCLGATTCNAKALVGGCMYGGAGERALALIAMAVPACVRLSRKTVTAITQHGHLAAKTLLVLTALLRPPHAFPLLQGEHVGVLLLFPHVRSTCTGTLPGTNWIVAHLSGR
jgi:hypothetical protein